MAISFAPGVYYGRENMLVVSTHALGVYHKASDYVVFHCPWCEKRNKQSIHAAKGWDGNRESYSYGCNGCGRAVEVLRPLASRATGPWLRECR